MPTKQVYDLLEFNRIKEAVASCAVSQRTKREVISSYPSFNKEEIKVSLAFTQEADLMLNKFLLNPLVAIDEIDEILEKARIDSTLTMGELLKVARVLRSARIAKSTVESAPDEIVLLRKLCEGIFVDKLLEKNITSLSSNLFGEKATQEFLRS